ncbi:hypothetical protein EI42_06007 [Thermosporothrix hazakensis]|jgi:hypothetical protein|uniref:Uncharacterized protein n=1 Tax=Thermosporothrix hazakensis TaxID=644383 RepID=A0A326U6D9_THEHA|nr:hypothetical protein [Thermosporothrix hazakensis]PZW19698.1 hypothetical protein EI42_06007 [Thermosporothrix hazakensis]GCE49190.1 hypothetical protein KTH_40590 [Thermosporothrix hazakensis]
MSQFAYNYNPRARRYVDLKTGRFVPERIVRQAVDAVIDKETQRVRDLSQQLVDRTISLAQWQVGMLSILKPLHVAMAMIGNGGAKNMSPADYGFVGNLLKEQYLFLRGFVKDIKTGKQALDGTLLARSALYTQAARGSHEAMRERVARIGGARLQRSILGIADHCTGCLQEARKGWQPIGSLIPIGQRQCKSHCRCTMQYK